MTIATDERNRRSRRRTLLGGGLALVVVYAVGAVVRVPYVEDDLSTRVERRLAAEGIVVQAQFSGQDGILRCAGRLANPGAAVSFALGVWGVHGATLRASCGTGGVPADATTTAMDATTTVAPTTSAPASSTGAATTSPASTTSPATTSTEAATVQFGAQLVDGRLVLAGTVSSDLERLALVERAAGAVDPANVANQLAVDPSAVTVPADRFTAFLDLLGLMPLNLVAADLECTGVEVSVRGSYADDAFRASFGSAAKRVGVAAALTERKPATTPQAAALEAELNALVAAEPILFDKGSTNISAFSVATVQKVAGMAKRYAGVTIEVQGHTDSEGDPGRNLTLSEQRAGSVLAALGALGVPVADLTAKGFGMTQLLTDANGNEIPDKSRRVVFGVTVV